MTSEDLKLHVNYRLKSSWPAELLSASQEGLCSNRLAEPLLCWKHTSRLTYASCDMLHNVHALLHSLIRRSLLYS